MTKIRPLDILILALVIFLAVITMKKSLTPLANKVTVQANGQHYEYSLQQNGIYSVNGLLGETSFEIKNGKVRILDSPCPNKTCVNQGWASTLICLPNKVIIKLENPGDFDAISE